jgi:AraC-like DNA-binding protein
VETLLFSTASVAAGTFRCATDHPLFADSGPSSTYCFVFPRTSVWIRHVAATPYLGSPVRVALYNEGQEYTRRALSASGDRSDWFAVAPAILEDALASSGASAARGSRRLFTAPYVPGDARLYLAQRRLQEQLLHRIDGEMLEAEEAIIGMLETIVTRLSRLPRRGTPAVTARQRNLADAAAALVVSRVHERWQIADLAGALGSSVFHLCRTFRRVTGLTIHQFRSALRLRMALEPLARPRPADLTHLALDLGYCSHSHFTMAFRRAYGLTPSAFVASVTRSPLDR